MERSQCEPSILVQLMQLRKSFLSIHLSFVDHKNIFLPLFKKTLFMFIPSLLNSFTFHTVVTPMDQNLSYFSVIVSSSAKSEGSDRLSVLAGGLTGNHMLKNFRHAVDKLEVEHAGEKAVYLPCFRRYLILPSSSSSITHRRNICLCLSLKDFCTWLRSVPCFSATSISQYVRWRRRTSCSARSLSICFRTLSRWSLIWIF